MLIAGYGSDVCVHDLWVSHLAPICKQWFSEKQSKEAKSRNNNGYHETYGLIRTQAVKLIYEEEAYSIRKTTFFIYLVFTTIYVFNAHKGTNYQAFNQKQVVEDYLAGQSFDNNLEEILQGHR